MLENLRNLREKHNLTQKELAQKLNMAVTTYGSYEFGKSEPSVQTLLRLSKLYKISIDAIVGNDFKYNSQQLECLEYISQLNQSNLIQAIFYIKTLLLYQQQRM